MVLFARSSLVVLMVPVVATLSACNSPQRALPACMSDDAGVPVGVAREALAHEATLIAAGDIVQCGNAGAERTAKLLDGMPGTIAALGDNVYESGSLDEFLDCYEPTWGRHRARTRPAVGNHEYGTPNAGAYFAYFCGAAGEPFKGWYSYELGSWHIVVLNSNCDDVECGEGSEQERWLRQDLAAHPTKCTAAYWHHPPFSSGEHGNNPKVGALWRALYEAGAEVVLTGHDHDYERFEPLSADGELDEARGIRTFVIGTGGRDARPFNRVKAHSVFRKTDLLGVLALTLREDHYEWKFVRDDGSVTDTGRGECH